MPPRLATVLVRAASRLAPRRHRARFLGEWRAELWHVAGTEGRAKALWVACGSFADALAMGALDHREQREESVGEWIVGFGRDLRTAVRGLARSPGYAAVAVVTLALGIGGSAALFTLLERVVLDPLPYPAADRLVRLQNQVPGVGPDEVWNASTAQYVYFTDHASSLDEVGVYRRFGGTLARASDVQRVGVATVTVSVLDLLGARASQGRILGPADDRPGAPTAVVLSHGFWQEALGADPSVVGSTLTLNDEPVQVVGVLAPGIDLPGGALTPPDVWLPMRIDRGGYFGNNHVFPMIGRLAPGATPEGAGAEIGRLTARLPEAFPQAYSQAFFDRYGFRTEVLPLKDDVLGDMGRNLWILFGAVGLVLLIACANVANLFIVRMEGRRHELDIRTALGAGRAALWRHLLAEGLALSAAGAVLGLVVAFWGVPALVAAAPEGLPRMDHVAMGATTVLAAAALALLVGVALGAGPALAHSGAPAGVAAEGRSTTAGGERRRLRSALVVGQVALALTLVVASGLLVRTLAALHHTALGFDPEGVTVAEVYPSPARYADSQALWGFYAEVLTQVRALPGVAAAGFGEEVPVAGGYGCVVQLFEDASVYERIEDQGRTTCAGEERVTPGYFEALGMTVLEGRTFTDADNDDPTRGAAVVSRAFAERFWPGEDALGKGVSPPGNPDPPFYHVVGVVDDVPTATGSGRPPFSEPAVAVYYPVVKIAGVERWWQPAPLNLVVKGGGAGLASALRRTVADVDAQAPLANLTDMETVVRGAMGRIAFVSLLLGVAAAVALLLAAVGLYGVIAYVAGRRTREIGMRMAMGARAGEVQRMIVGESLKLAALGLVVGAALALATTRVMAGLLVGVTPTDPVALAAAATLLAGVALLASWLPARRASRIDPAAALRAG